MEFQPQLRASRGHLAATRASLVEDTRAMGTSRPRLSKKNCRNAPTTEKDYVFWEIVAKPSLRWLGVNSVACAETRRGRGGHGPLHEIAYNQLMLDVVLRANREEGCDVVRDREPVNLVRRGAYHVQRHAHQL